MPQICWRTPVAHHPTEDSPCAPCAPVAETHLMCDGMAPLDVRRWIGRPGRDSLLTVTAQPGALARLGRDRSLEAGCSRRAFRCFPVVAASRWSDARGGGRSWRAGIAGPGRG